MSVDSNTEPEALQPPDTTFMLRPVTAEDIPSLRAGCWSHHNMTRCINQVQTVSNASKRHRGLGVVVESPDKSGIIAYGQVMTLTRCCEISDLIVSPEYRSMGIGTALIQYLSRYIRKNSRKVLEIGVSRRNPRALALYERLGFKHAYELELDTITGKEFVIYLQLPVPEQNKKASQF